MLVLVVVLDLARSVLGPFVLEPRAPVAIRASA